MKMNDIFDSFKKYVDSMDDAAIRESIHAAVEHTSHSAILDGVLEAGEGDYEKSSTQEVQTVIVSRNRYGFVTSGIDLTQSSYNLSGRRGVAA